MPFLTWRTTGKLWFFSYGWTSDPFPQCQAFPLHFLILGTPFLWAALVSRWVPESRSQKAVSYLDNSTNQMEKNICIMNHMIEKSEQKTSQVYNISHAFHVGLPLAIFHKAHFYKKVTSLISIIGYLEFLFSSFAFYNGSHYGRYF